jgi:hypothetical protein
LSRRRGLLTLAVWAAVSAAGSFHLAQAAGDVDFTRDVRPILARHCFKCHGPDDSARQSGLRLDLREGALAGGESGEKAVVPGAPDKSELIRRIASSDDAQRMPPPEAGPPLTQAQQDVLRRWIGGGAVYRQHWAFVAPQRPAVPTVRRADWPQNPLDNFVLAKLEAAGLKPSPPADRYTLVRRVYLDLIGLLPTPEEADAFAGDTSPGAYARLVDRLLASPHYGERWARRWLDLARYADTNGFEKDRPRSIWPYRDWVIHALNEDLPFDQFTIEQLAGDMLPGAALSQRVATGFHRNTMTNEEGGIDPLEFRFHSLVDRVNTTATVWLGLTLGCSQCHTHKFDPLPQREYYELMAFLNNADEIKLELPLPELAARRRELEAQLAQLQRELPSRFPLPAGATPQPGQSAADLRRQHMREAFEQWLAQERPSAVAWQVLRPTKLQSNLPALELLPDGSVLASGDQSKRDVYELEFAGDLRGVTALRLEALPHESLPRGGPGRTYYEGPEGDFFLSELVVQCAGERVRFAGASETYAKLGIGGGASSAALAVDGEPHTGWSTSGKEGQAHQAVFHLQQPLAGGKLTVQMIFERHYAADLGRFRISITREPRAITARSRPAEIEDLLCLPPEKLTPVDEDRLLRQFLLETPELAAARDEIQKLRSQIPEYPTTLVFQERPHDRPRQTHLHRRGEFLQPTDPVEPAVPSVLHPLPHDAPRDRVALARWLVDPANPLVGRVTVNRHWAAFFGRGLVRTLEDFGYQGEPPTHPELLDWLAVEFVEQGWSVKALHRLMVTSATYRQAAIVTPELAALDPGNALLARGPRFRLEGELIRDATLSAAGLLWPKLGGPSVFPPQNASVTTEGAYGKLEWKVSPGEDRYRRGLYTFSKRTAPFAMYTTFDGPSGEACVPRREVSNTPLQALTLLNDPVFVEAAAALGSWTSQQPGPVENQARALFRRCLTRPPAQAELSAIVTFYQEQAQRLAGDDKAAAVIAGGNGTGAAERAAWTAVARVLLNTDEFVTKN